MRNRQARDVPAGLEGVRRRFERWRNSHRARSRIPDLLWAAAVKMAQSYGIHRASRTLRIDYYALKKRVEQHSNAVQGRRESGPIATFMELSAPADHGFAAVPAGACACTLELEAADGSKMRVHLKTATPPDLATLCRSVWNPAS
jgi:hypothetical protein